METENVPEFANIPEIIMFGAKSVIKTVPIVTDQIMSSVIYIDSYKKMIAFRDELSDRIYHIISGSGRITLGEEEIAVGKGTLALVPKGRTHYFSTDSEHMTVLCVRPVRSHIDNLKDMGEN